MTTTSDFTTTFLVAQSPKEVFDAIKNVRGWWSGLFGEQFKGKSEKLNDEFTFRAGEGMHYSKQKLVELIPDKKIVWLVTDSKLTFLEDQSEWNDTKISFEISKIGDKTQVKFTHLGLVPKIECYDSCSSAWSEYLQKFHLSLDKAGSKTHLESSRIFNIKKQIMKNQDFTTTILVDQSPTEVFKGVTDVRGWWSEEIKGNTTKLNDEFDYQYQDVHRCKMKLIEVIPDQKVVWLVLDNYFSFTVDKKEWIGTKIFFEISKVGNKTQLQVTHEGLVPAYECYSACSNGWTHYIQESLKELITTGKGQPNGKETAYTIHEIAARFSKLAQEEKWFEIQDELFADHVKSIEPTNSPYFKNAEGKADVRKKGEDWMFVA